jgi:lipase
VTAHGGRFANLAAAGLAERFHVVAPDLRGHGFSTWDPPWSIEQHLDDLLRLTPTDSALWVGHSFGGRLLLELAHRRPDRVARGVLLDPAIWVPPAEARPRAEELREDRAYGSVAASLDERPDSDELHGSARTAAELDMESHLERGGDGLLRSRYCRSAAIAAYGEMARLPPTGLLQSPLRIVRAESSNVCPPELITAYKTSAGQLLSSVSVRAGHTLMWTAPRETNEAIESFLSP